MRDRFARRRTSAFVRAQFSLIAALVDAGVITVSALVAGVIYHGLFYHLTGFGWRFGELGLVMGLLFVVFSVLRGEYQIGVYLTYAGHARRTLLVWNLCFLTALLFVFVTKQTADYSRAAALAFYGFGLFALVTARLMAVSNVKTSAIVGKISALRIVLIGHEAEVRDFTSRYTPWLSGVDIVASFVLRGKETLREDVALARASARVLRPDDIFILLPMTETEAIDACVAAFMKIPASIHLGPQRVLDRFSSAHVSRIGKMYSLQLVRRPLTLVEIVTKRAFDLAVTIPLIVLLCPCLILVALAIQIDSRGPVFFMQRRYGFNQETFRIIKFRSMTVTEDDKTLRQATRNDPRITRVGRFIRRWNIDELPQLLNVLRGEMSLVGPRPHALVHNHNYEQSIADYARRHNVKPGITGWAQVNGLRGEIAEEAFMRRRVEHDLFYIDNWSIGLDIRILAMTLLSRKAFENAV